MPLPDDSTLYSIRVEDIRQVVEEEEFRKLTDEEIKRVGDKIGDYIGWYDAALMAIREVAPDVANTKKEDNE